jgi:hypothetical protein
MPSATNPRPAQAWQRARTREERDAAQRKIYGGYTLAELDMVAMCPHLCAKRHGKIPERVSKDPVPFEPTILQARMFLHYENCQRDERPCRMVTVKIRRGGGSTGAAWLMYLHAHNYQARLGAIGTDEKVSMNMFAMMRFFDKHETMPGWLHANKILETGLMAWPNGSLRRVRQPEPREPFTPAL